MARLVARSALRTRVRQRADVENDPHVSDTEINDLLNEKWAVEVYDLIVEAAPHDYYLSTSTVSVVSGTIAYALPSDYYKTRDIYEDRGSGRRRYLERLPSGTRDMYEQPGGAVTLLHKYIPVAASFANDAATIDGVNGWEELLVLSAAIDIVNKQERNPDRLELAYQRMEKHVRDMAGRNGGAPPLIKQVRAGRDPFDLDNVTAYDIVGSNLEIYRPSTEYPP